MRPNPQSILIKAINDAIVETEAHGLPHLAKMLGVVRDQTTEANWTPTDMDTLRRMIADNTAHTKRVEAMGDNAKWVIPVLIAAVGVAEPFIFFFLFHVVSK